MWTDPANFFCTFYYYPLSLKFGWSEGWDGVSVAAAAEGGVVVGDGGTAEERVEGAAAVVDRHAVEGGGH